MSIYHENRRRALAAQQKRAFRLGVTMFALIALVALSVVGVVIWAIIRAVTHFFG